MIVVIGEEVHDIINIVDLETKEELVDSEGDGEDKAGKEEEVLTEYKTNRSGEDTQGETMMSGDSKMSKSKQIRNIDQICH